MGRRSARMLSRPAGAGLCGLSRFGFPALRRSPPRRVMLGYCQASRYRGTRARGRVAIAVTEPPAVAGGAVAVA